MPQSFSFYQLLVPLFACCMIVRSISKYRRHCQTIREVIAVILIWSMVAAVAIFPDFFMGWLSTVTGIKSGFNALIFFTLVILIFSLLQLFIKLEELERTITELVRKIALRGIENGGKQ